MTGDTLFDHQLERQEERGTQVEPPSCKTLEPECGCGNKSGACAFAAWAVAVAGDLHLWAPDERDLPKGHRVLGLDPEQDALGYLLSKKALGSHYPGEKVAFPGFYAFQDNPLDQGVRLVQVLYSRAHDPQGDLPVDHRAGYRVEPDVCRFESFFAAGFVENGENAAELTYSETRINIRDLVCGNQEDLEALYQKILQSRTTRTSM